MEAAIPPDLLSGLRIAGMHLASVGRKFFSSKSWRRGPRRFGLCAHGFDHLGIRQLDYGAASPAGVPNRGPEEIAPCAVDKYKPIMKITGLANIECDVRVLRHELLRLDSKVCGCFDEIIRTLNGLAGTVASVR
jgi:hypothetical protein